MAFSQVQTASVAQTQANSQVVTVTSTGQWNLVCVGIKMLDLNETCTSVTDSAGNTYVLTSAVDSSGNTRMYTAYGIQTTGGATTVTANYSGSATTKRMFVDEYSGFSSGMTNALAFDTTQTGTGSGTSMAVSTLTPAQTGELIWATLVCDNDYTFTAGANYTLYGQGSNSDLRSQYRLSGGASETAPATISLTITWTERAIAFKDVPTSGTLDLTSKIW